MLRAVCAALVGELTENLIFESEYTTVYKSKEKININCFASSLDIVVNAAKAIQSELTTSVSFPCTVQDPNGILYPGYIYIGKTGDITINENISYYLPGQRQSVPVSGSTIFTACTFHK